MSEHRKLSIQYILADQHGCGYYRAVMPARMLQRAGHEVRLTGLDTLVPGADIVIYQRSYTEPALGHIAQAKAAGAVTVYEADDDMFHIAPNNPAAPFFQGKPQAVIVRMLRAADAALTTTPENAAWMGEHNPRVHVVPNMFAFQELWPLTRPVRPRPPGSPRIGFAGGSSHASDLNVCLPALRQICAEIHGIKICFFGYWGEPHHSRVRAMIPPGNLELTGGVPFDQYYLTLACLGFDIGIAPLEFTAFNACKSMIKYLEYTLAGAVTVATAIPDFARTIEHGRNGFLIRKNRHGEWLDALRRMAADADARRAVWENARDDILANHDLGGHWRKYEDLFLDLARLRGGGGIRAEHGAAAEQRGADKGGHHGH